MLFRLSWLILGALACAAAPLAARMVTRDFEFTSAQRRLSGIIDLPATGDAQACVIFVHGSGATDVRAENSYADLRQRFTAMGIACVTWDKPGCGRSEGTFDANQPLQETAQEILDAATALRAAQFPGVARLGVWATSRGAWATPIALARDRAIRFWISVSGASAEDNKHYLLRSNLPLEGRTPQQTAQLMQEWRRGREIFLQGGSYDEYLAATTLLRKDPAVQYFAGDLTGTQDDYVAEQARYLKAKDQVEFDPDTLSIILVRDLDRLLRALEIDVLALWGEKDTNQDWRRARELYERTLGRNPKATLEVRTFPDANHSLNVSATGSVREVEGMPMEAGKKVAGYYEVQLEWLKRRVLAGER